MSRKHVMLQREKMAHAGYLAPMTKAGSTANVDVLYATSLGKAGAGLAKLCLARCEADHALVSGWFGRKLPRAALLVYPLDSGHDGSGGAEHYGCAATDLYCDADFLDDGSTTLALFVAELSEVGQAQQAKGWDCGASNGEALSRLHAELAHPSVLDGYSTAAAWLDTPDRPDWITQSDPTDQDAVSTGCGVLFLTWLLSRGFTLTQITQAAAPTLAGTYKALYPAVPSASVFSLFLNACQTNWPLGKPSGVTVDNPWGVAPPPPPVPPPVPPPIPVPPTPPDAGTIVLRPGTYTLIIKGA